jgi:hemoglobin/transferrin/lactoferrin receptor protein
LIQRDSDLTNRQYTLGYKFASPDNPLIDFSAKIYRNTTDLEQLRRSNNAERYFDIATDGIDVYNTSRFTFGSTKLALTYGGDSFRDEVDTLDIASNGDEFTPSGERTVSGAFVQSQLSFNDTVELITALRYDTYELSSDGLNSDGDHVSPKVTLGVTPIKGITLFSTYAEGYRAPALSETLPSGQHPGFPFIILPNPALEAEVAHNIEGGVNLKFDGIATAGDAFRAKAVVYHNRVENYIGPSDKTQGPGGSPGSGQMCSAGPGINFPCGSYQYVNIGEATLEGVELELNYDARSWFFIAGASHVRGTDETTGDPLLTVPADQLTTTLGFRALGDKLVAGSRARFVAAQDRVPASSSLIVPTSGYTIVDLFAQYELSDQATVNLNIDNLFDKTYLQYLDLQNDPGFNARIGLTMRLGAK